MNVKRWLVFHQRRLILLLLLASIMRVSVVFGGWSCVDEEQHDRYRKPSEYPSFAPTISKTTPRNTSVQLGQNVTLECGETNPRVKHPNIEWLKWNHSLSWENMAFDLENGSYTLVRETAGKYMVRVDASSDLKTILSKLVILNVTADDFGLYTCVACNRYGRRYRSALLQNVETFRQSSTETSLEVTTFNGLIEYTTETQVKNTTVLDSNSSAKKSLWSPYVKIVLIVIVIVLMIGMIAAAAFFIWKRRSKTKKKIISNNETRISEMLPQEQNHLIINGDGTKLQQDDCEDSSTSLKFRQTLTGSTLPFYKYRHLSDRSQCSYSLSCKTDVTGFEELPEEMIDENWEIDRSSVEIKDKLGEGAFGQVMKGLVYSLHNQPQQVEVAVKMLKDCASERDLVDLISEMETMKEIGSHKNIINLLGCCSVNGESYKSLQYVYRIPSQTIGQIIPEVCSAIIKELKDYIKVPQTVEQWKAIAAEFKERWNFNNCLVAMDGKHVVIRPPPGSGSYYFNYKHTFSIVLLALVDADYQFIYVDVGTNGRISDGGVFKNSDLAQALENGDLNIPEPTSLPNRNKKLPYVIVADDAFPLTENIMKPYSLRGLTQKQRIFNYRLSRARRIVENAFGILANRFRVFMTPIALCPENVEKIVMAACSLHNFLRSKSNARNVYTPVGIADIEDIHTHDILPGQWRLQPNPEGLVPLSQQGSNRCRNTAKEIRDEFCTYFNSTEGQVEWQWDKV